MLHNSGYGRPPGGSDGPSTNPIPPSFGGKYSRPPRGSDGPSTGPIAPSFGGKYSQPPGGYDQPSTRPIAPSFGGRYSQPPGNSYGPSTNPIPPSFGRRYSQPPGGYDQPSTRPIPPSFRNNSYGTLDNRGRPAASRFNLGQNQMNTWRQRMWGGQRGNPAGQPQRRQRAFNVVAPAQRGGEFTAVRNPAYGRQQQPYGGQGLMQRNY